MKPATIIIFLLSINIYAQQTESENAAELNSRLKFYFTNGYGAIYQSAISDNTFYRIHTDIGINISENSTDYFATAEYAVGDYTKSKETQKDKAFSIMLAPEYGINLINKKYAALYLGGGPYFYYEYQFQLSERSYERTTGVISTPYSQTKTYNNTYSAGLIIFAGIESKINENFSIFAEFNITGGRTWKDDKSDNLQNNLGNTHVSTNKNTINKWDYEFSKVKLGVSILF